MLYFSTGINAKGQLSPHILDHVLLSEVDSVKYKATRRMGSMQHLLHTDQVTVGDFYRIIFYYS
jgi:hypothetical protein